VPLVARGRAARAGGDALSKAGGSLECPVLGAVLRWPARHRPGPRPPRCPTSHEHLSLPLRLAQQPRSTSGASPAAPCFLLSKQGVHEVMIRVRPCATCHLEGGVPALRIAVLVRRCSS